MRFGPLPSASPPLFLSILFPVNDDQIFADAIDLPPSDRTSFLEKACQDDDQQRRLTSLLLSHEAAASFLENPAVNRENFSGSDAQLGEVIGTYTLKQIIGEGGCGTVFLAEQSAPVRRLVALKLIKLGMDSANVIQRFEAERQALAMMDHPDIARVFDAGTTDSGRPFFVMEYVDGSPITTFADEQGLGLSARLELFTRVCEAVQHAHQKGVIHRDLKPSNILVTLHGGVPTPKVIDFGIAKATEGSLTEATLLTAVEQFIGTPAYMSPEQAQLSSADIDTRSDIYSLGVLLYELLTGSTPFETRKLLQIGLDEMRRHIREVDPPRPSTRLNTLASDTLATTASRRHLAAPTLVNRLRGDLDWIVMRCLEKDRGRRYDSATGLAQDLKRHLRNEPVEARPASASYRLGKLMRRNRVVFAAGTVVTLSLICGIVMTTRQTFRANEAEKLARQEASIASAVNGFLTNDILRQADSFEQANTGGAADAQLTLREALDRAAANVGDRFPDQPLTEAAVRLTIGQSYLGVSASPEAETQLRRAAELRHKHLGEDHPDSIQVQFELGRAQLGQSLFDEAIASFRNVTTHKTARLGINHSEVSYSRNSLAQALEEAGEYAEAETLYRDLLERRRRNDGETHKETSNALNNLALLLERNGKRDEAQSLYQESIANSQVAGRDDHPDTLNTLNNYATLLSSMSKFDESVALFEKILPLLEAAMGGEHHITVASKLNYARVLKQLKRLDEAEVIEEQLVEISRRRFGPDHVTTITVMNNYASTLIKRGKTEKALSIREDVLEKSRRISGENHPSTLAILANIGFTLKALKRYPEAIIRIEESIAGFDSVFGPQHPTNMIIKGNLAGIYGLQGDWSKAAEIWRWKLDIQKAELEPGHPQRVLTSVDLAKAYDNLSEPAKSVPLWTALVDVQRENRGVEDLETIATIQNLAIAYLAQFDDGAAEPLLREILPLRTRLRPDHWSTFLAQSSLGGIVARKQEFATAEPLLLTGYEGMRAHQSDIPAAMKHHLPAALKNIIDLYVAWGRTDDANQWQAEFDLLESATE